MFDAKNKEAAALAAIEYLPLDRVIGVGTGSTVDYFIKALVDFKNKIEGVVSSSERTTKQLKALGLPVLDLNSVNELPVYVDGADEVDPYGRMIKGGGGALTREKIVAAVAKQFICIVDQSKKVKLLGEFPVAIEVIPMARSFVAREIVRLGGEPTYRAGVVTDNGNVILDVHNLGLTDPKAVETAINQIAGVVASGIFAARRADIVLVGSSAGVEKITIL